MLVTIAAAVASMRVPGCAKGGSVPVTMTAAVLFTRIAVEGTVNVVGSDVRDRHDLQIVRVERPDQHISFVPRADDPDANGIVDLLVSEVEAF